MGLMGLTVEWLEPIERVGRIGNSDLWSWLSSFYESYLPRVEERGLVSAEDHAAWREEMVKLAAAGDTDIRAPTVADLILRKPA